MSESARQIEWPTVTLFVRLRQAAGEYFLGGRWGLALEKAVILSRSLPSPAQSWALVGPALTCSHGVGGRIECMMWLPFKSPLKDKGDWSLLIRVRK
jgi:hypothetical protein